MIEKVYANPNSLELRQVVADYLQEQGDIRGEFIALQLYHLHHPETPASRDREHALWTAHLATWYPTLHGWIDRRKSKFYAGFLQHMCFRLNANPQAPVAGAPEWQTVQSLDLASITLQEPLTEVLSHPVMAGLRSLSNLQSGEVSKLDPHRPLPITELMVGGSPDPLATMGDTVALPELKKLSIRLPYALPPRHSLLPDRQIWRSVRHLEFQLPTPVDPNSASLASWVADLYQLPRLQQFSLRLPTTQIQFTRTNDGWK